MKDNCPTHDILAQFVSATLTDTEADKIVAHLDSCESCGRTVDELERTQPAMAALDQLRNVDGLDKIESPLPKKIGQYEIVEQIGQGGMGVVYRAVHPHLKREVALKMIRDSRLDDPMARERFVQEMQSLGKLSHQNIVLATDAGIDGDVPFIVTELLDGHDLGTWIAAHGKMPVKQAIDCIRQAATGLAYAHEKGYVHRDIKPSNLFLTHDGVIKILDLGIARPTETSPGSGQTVTGHIVGSPEFMAPEQFHDGTADARSDIYSLGRTFLYLLIGNPDAGRSASIPRSLHPILTRMTAGTPELRFQSASELLRTLPHPSSLKNRLQRSLVAACIVLMLTFGIMFVRFQKKPDLLTDTILTPEQSESVQKSSTKFSDLSSDTEIFAEKDVVPVSFANDAPIYERKDNVSPPVQGRYFEIEPFDIRSQSSWDAFFRAIVTDYTQHLDRIDWNEPYHLILSLHQLGLEGKAHILIDDILKRKHEISPNRTPLEFVEDLLTVGFWEKHAGCEDQAKEIFDRVRNIRDPMFSEESKPGQIFIRERERYLANFYWEPKMNYDGTLFETWLKLGKPSVVQLCQEEKFEEAIRRYAEIERHPPELPGHENNLLNKNYHDLRELYRGYGLAYVISRMIDNGNLEDAQRLWLGSTTRNPMYFRSGCLLCSAFIKKENFTEAQKTWSQSLDTLGKTPISTNYDRAVFLCLITNSILESDLYNQVKRIHFQAKH